MSKLTSNQVSQNSSKLNISNISMKPKNKSINYQEIISLKKLLKSEVREAKGQELVNTYIKLLEREYENIIEKSINNSELIKAHKNNRIFQKVLDKTKNKIKQQNSKSISKKDSLNNTRSFSVTNKISTSKSSLNISPIKKVKKKIEEEIHNDDNNNKPSTYWQDYDFLKVPLYPKTNKKTIKNKNRKSNNPTNKKFTNTTTISKANYSKTKQLENYYLYLLNRRQKICENKETNEERQQEKIELEILRQIFEKIYNEDEKLKKNLEDENIPEFYKRFIIQNEIKKDNIFSKEFKLNCNESQNLEGPKLCNKSRLICKYVIDYEPIYKRLDRIIKNQKKNLEKIKARLMKNKNRKNSASKKSNLNDTKEWLKSMDNWYERKNKKIKEKKEEIEKNNPDNKECVFRPLINHNARIKKDDEGLLCSDRLYLEYFILREKKQQMIEKEKNNYSFQPNVNYRKDFVSPDYAF